MGRRQAVRPENLARGRMAVQALAAAVPTGHDKAALGHGEAARKGAVDLHKARGLRLAHALRGPFERGLRMCELSEQKPGKDGRNDQRQSKAQLSAAHHVSTPYT